MLGDALSFDFEIYSFAFIRACLELWISYHVHEIP